MDKKGSAYYWNIKRHKKSFRNSSKAKKVLESVKFTLISVAFFTAFVAFAFFLLRGIILAEFGPYLNSPKEMLNYKSDTLTFYDRNGEVIYRTTGRYIDKITPLSKISPDLIKATIAIEDRDFYHHSGISFRGMTRAVYTDLKNENMYYQGGSTISQQLARTIFLNNDKSVFRKIKETILALEIEKKYSKDEILEMYLNSIYYGADSYGIEAAAKNYFSTTPDKLDLAQAAMLAGLPIAPSRLSPTLGDAAKAKERQGIILDCMKKEGIITAKEAREAVSEELKYAVVQNDFPAPHFLLYLKQQLAEQFPKVDIDHSGFKVYTTLDMNLQEKAERLLTENVSSLKYRNVSNGAFLSLDPKTGEILAMVGSVDFYQRDWGAVNMLTAFRSPGSSIKPVVYAAAFENKKIATTTVLHDTPTTYKNDWEVYTPVDSDGKYRGTVLPRRALANSLNIPAVEVTAKTGIPTILDEAAKLGITGLGSPSNYWYSIGIGGLEVRGIDLAGAYATIANEGKLVRPTGIINVKDKFDKTIFQPTREEKQVLDPRVAYILTNILSDNAVRRELFGWPNPLEIGRVAAVKTGTGQDFKDTWAIGYTPSLLSLVWMGNNDGSPMDNIWGLESAALVWNRFMREALVGSPVEQFSVPAGVQFASVCSLDGSQAVMGQPSTQELFFAGEVPTNYGACAFLAKQKEEQAKLAVEQERLRLLALQNESKKEAQIIIKPIGVPK
jgi:penicillin-binding protein 1C